MIRSLNRGLLGLLLLLAASQARAQVPPARAEHTLEVVKGLSVRLWASEPLFVNPTCMDVDHRGRVWVCESVNYRNILRGQKGLTRPAGDRIVILDDPTGAGKATKATTFYQSPELHAPLGIAVAKDPAGPGFKVFVCQSPDILLFEDKDGDGKADGPPTKLLTGFGGIDHDHGVHGILIGPDRRLYFSVGDTGVHGLQSSDKKGRAWHSNDTDCRAGTIWRCELDGTDLQLIAHNFRNEYEPCVDSFGTVFVSDNDDDGNQQTRICYVMPGGDYGYHPRGRGETHWHEEQPGVVPKILRTFFGSPTGMCVYEGTLLPKPYRGQLLHTDAGPQHVRCYHLKPQGASYAVAREDMVTSSDRWFRPSDVCVGPDGSVYVADWYDPGVGGHGIGDWTRGRIFRISPGGTRAANPAVDLSTDRGTLAALASPALSTRYMAMARVAAMKRAEVVKLLTPAATQTEDAVLRARALWQLARAVGGSGAKCAALDGLLDDPDPRFQVLGLRLRRDFLGKRGSLPADLIRLAKEKTDASVLREGLLTLRDTPAEEAHAAVIELMKRYDGKDRFYLAAVGIAVGKHDRKRRAALLADFERQFPEWDDRVANLVWELRPPGILPMLEKRLAEANRPADQKGRIVDILAGSAEPGAAEATLKVLSADVPADVRDRATQALRSNLAGRWRALRTGKALDAALDDLLARAETRGVALELIAAAEKADRAPRVLEIARARGTPVATRRAAIGTLGQLPGAAPAEALVGLLAGAGPEVRGDVIAALGNVVRLPDAPAGSKAALRALEELVIGAGSKPAAREAAVVALSASVTGSRWLIARHRAGRLPAGVVARAGGLLRASAYPEIQKEASLAFPPPGRLNPRRLPPIPVLAARRGDAARGKRLLAESASGNLQCLKCHTVRGVGGQVGPDLSMIGKKASRENLLESILYPSKAIADQFVTWVIETNRGLTVQGLLVEETPGHVILRDAEGRDTRVPSKHIERRQKSPKSLMPEDLAAAMTETELIDLVEYLLTLRTASLTPTTWHIAGPFDNGGGMAGLDRAFPPEKAVDLRATYDGKHGKVGWRTVRAGAGGYVDLQAFFAGKSDQIVSYLTQEVVSPVDQGATVLIGSDDGARLWVNGELVFTTKVTRAAAPEQDAVKVKLKKGTNRILFKINNGDGGHGLYFTLLSDQELKPTGR